ncbi:MAG: PGPGW domain-containing protein [Sciscionella sp.]
MPIRRRDAAGRAAGGESTRGRWTLRAPVRRTLLTAAGWLLVLLGIAALVLPGPGLLLLLAGLVVLSQEYAWAERRVEPLKVRAFEAARLGVASWPRVTASALAACAVIAAGVVWGIDPPVPSVGPLGPDLPFGGWATGGSIIASGVIALSLVAHSVHRFRSPHG